jgi:hypothetical protein
MHFNVHEFLRKIFENVLRHICPSLGAPLPPKVSMRHLQHRLAISVCAVSGYRHGVGKRSRLVIGYNRTFRDKLSVPAWPLNMGKRGCPETSVTTDQTTSRPIPEKRTIYINLSQACTPPPAQKMEIKKILSADLTFDLNYESRGTCSYVYLFVCI